MWNCFVPNSSWHKLIFFWNYDKGIWLLIFQITFCCDKIFPESSNPGRRKCHSRFSSIGIVIIWHVLCYLEVKAGIMAATAINSQFNSGSKCTRNNSRMPENVPSTWAAICYPGRTVGKPQMEGMTCTWTSWALPAAAAYGKQKSRNW